MDLEVIKEITASSNVLVTWSISLFGASLLAILSTSYIRPAGKWSKLMYLLFMPAWFYLATAIYFGNVIARRQVMAAVKPERISFILERINDEYSLLLDAFNTALVFFALWLVIFLLWWVFQDFMIKSERS